MLEKELFIRFTVHVFFLKVYQFVCVLLLLSVLKVGYGI